MSIKSALGLGGKKVRYGIVSLGDIAQEAFLPGVAHTGNSELVAFVTGDPEKAREVGKRYGVERCYGYGDYAALLASGEIDAVYIASPNFRHAEFAIPALEAASTSCAKSRWRSHPSGRGRSSRWRGQRMPS